MIKQLSLRLARLVAAAALVVTAAGAHAQFTPGQILTASQLNSAFAAKTTNAAAAITGGTITGLSSPLPVASGGTGATTLVGLVSPSYIAAQGADTVLANATSSSASPTAFAMPSCSTSTSALQFTSGTGFTCYGNSATTVGTLAQFAATTSAQLAGVLSDETGSGAAVFGTSPTIGTPTINTPTISGGTINNATVGITTPLAGKFTTLQATAAITPTYPAGVVGNATGSAVSAGSVGEFVFSSVPTGSAVALTTGVAANVTSISLTAGDWDVWGSVGVVTGASTVVSSEQGGINTTSATLPAFPGAGGQAFLPLTLPTGQGMLMSVGQTRLLLSATTTVYLVASFSFSTSTCSAYGFIGAHRR